MKVAELLRKLADVIAAAEQTPLDAEQSEQTDLVQVEVPNDDQSESGVFVPPLQAKLELLKKSEGIPNVYDNDDEAELADIKKNAGITPAQHIAGEDNDITG